MCIKLTACRRDINKITQWLLIRQSDEIILAIDPKGYLRMRETIFNPKVTACIICRTVNTLAGMAESMAGATFTIGDKFWSYAQLKEKVAAYEKAKCVQLNHSDSRTLKTASKLIPRKAAKANQDLVYYFIKFSCVFGGKKYQGKGKGKRPKQKSVMIMIHLLHVIIVLLNKTVKQ